MKNLLKTEPAVTVGAAVTAVGAVVAGAAFALVEWATGLHADLVATVALVLAAVAPLATAFIARQFVWPNGRVEDRILDAETFVDVQPR